MHEEAKRCTEKIHDMLCKSEEALKMMLDAGCLMDTKVNDLPELTDIVKDLTEAKRNCMEACYYEQVIKAMDKAEKEDEEMERMGYNTRRYANGEYAPKGRGHISGYNPILRDRPYINAYLNDGMMGYDGNGNGNGSSSDSNRMGARTMNSQTGSDRSVRMGYDGSYYDGDSFFQYDDARRHYSETGSDKDRDEMDEKGMKHVKQSLKTFREIWEDADPVMRKELHKELSAAVAEMKP